MAIYNQSIFEIEEILKTQEGKNFTSAIVLPGFMYKHKELNTKDLLFLNTTGETYSKKYKIKVDEQKKNIDIENCCILKFSEKIKISGIDGYTVTSTSNYLNDMFFKCKNEIENVLYAIINKKTYEFPNNISKLDVAIIIVGVCITMNDRNDISDITISHFAASIWQEATSKLDKPITFLAAKDCPEKIILISCMGNYLDIKCAPHILPGSIIKFGGMFTENYVKIILAIRNEELPDVDMKVKSFKTENLENY